MMHITIETYEKSFNVCLSSKAGLEPFLTIKGCRIVDGAKGPFVSWPATKSERAGKYWNHVWANDKFQQAVIEEYDKAMAAAAPKKAARRQEPDDSHPPF